MIKLIENSSDEEIKSQSDYCKEEIKSQSQTTEIKQQTNVQINEAPNGNYGALMERLLGSK